MSPEARQCVAAGAADLQLAGGQRVEGEGAAAAGANADNRREDATLPVGVYLHKLHHAVARLVVDGHALHVNRVIAVDVGAVWVLHDHRGEVAAVAGLQEDDALDKWVYVHVIGLGWLGWGRRELVTHVVGRAAEVVFADDQIPGRYERIDQAYFGAGRLITNVVILEPDFARLVVQPHLVTAILGVACAVIGDAQRGNDGPQSVVEPVGMNLRAKFLL